MVDIDLLKSKLKSLSEYIQDLEEVKEVSLEEIKADKKLRRYIERTRSLPLNVAWIQAVMLFPTWD